MGGSEACRGLAFIVEGATEKVFYLEYLSQLCAAKGLALRKDLDTQEDRYAITSANDEKVVMMASVNSVSQMANPAARRQRPSQPAVFSNDAAPHSCHAWPPSPIFAKSRLWAEGTDASPIPSSPRGQGLVVVCRWVVSDDARHGRQAPARAVRTLPIIVFDEGGQGGSPGRCRSNFLSAPPTKKAAQSRFLGWQDS